MDFFPFGTDGDRQQYLMHEDKLESHAQILSSFLYNLFT